MNRYVRNKSGASMVIVTIIFVIFLALGVSVLVAASVSAGASAKNRDNKQLYFYAKSAAETINSSMQADNGIGYEIANMIASVMMRDHNDVSPDMTFDCNIFLTENGVVFDGVSFEDVSVRLSGVNASKTQSYTAIPGSPGNYNVKEDYSITVTGLTVTFVTSYRELEYRMDILYSFSAAGTREGNATGTGTVTSIDDLNLSSLPGTVTWNHCDVTFIKIYQG